MIQQNITAIKDRMQKACAKAGRNIEDVKLMLVTKTVPPEKIIEALTCQETLIGENKVQELRDKYATLQKYPHEAHLIGHLQTNKIKDALKYVSCIQSVDRVELIEKLDQRLQFEGRSIDILIQVNTSLEASKFGIAPEAAIALIQKAAQYDTLRIKGLMTIGIFSHDSHAIRNCFQRLRQIQQKAIELQLPNVSMETLSMGMSGDMDIAIEEGSTMVRVGSAIFGERNYATNAS